MGMQKLDSRKEQIIQVLIAIIAFFVFTLAIIIILPISIVSYAYKWSKIKLRSARKKLKDML